MPGRDHAPEVVPAEVDEHHVLGALLRVALELLGEDRVLGGRGATGARAGNRVGGELVAVELDEQLRRRADDLERGHADEEQVRARVDAAQASVQPDPVELPCRSTGSVGRSNDWRRARTTWIASPAAIASLATSTAWTYSSRPRLASATRRRAWPPCRPSCRAPFAPRHASRPQTAGRSARAPRRSPPPRSGSGPRGPGRPVWSDAIADSVWVRWSKTRTRSVSMNAAVGVPTGSASGSRHGRLEDRDRVVGERPDGAAGEPRHALASAATRRRPTNERSAWSGSGASSVRIGSSGSYRSTVTGRSWMRACPSRTSSSRRGPMPRNEYRPSRSPPSTDSSRYAGVVPSSRRRNAPMGVSRSAERVARSSSVSAFAASRFAWVRLSGSRRWSRAAPPVNQNDLSSSGTKGRAFRGATLIRHCRTFLTDGSSLDVDRRCPLSLALCAGAYLAAFASAVRSGGSRVHSPPPPSRFPPATGSLCRRSTGTRPVHQPVFD